MSAEIVKLPRKVRPLRKRYSPEAPYVLERHDQEDGSIQYEIWDYRPDTYRRLCIASEDCVDDDVAPDTDRGQAMKDANQIVRALNFTHQYKP